MSKRLWVTLLFTATYLISATGAYRGRKCQPKNVELDVVMVLDASSGVNKYGYAGEKAAVISLYSSLTISQELTHTQVATVYMGKKSAYNSSNLSTNFNGESAKNEIRNLDYLGGDLNILRGLSKAHSIVTGFGNREKVPKVIVIFSSVAIDCKNLLPSSQALSCEKLEELRQDGIIVISVDLRYHENPQKRKMSFGDFSLQNNETLVRDLQNIFCDVSPISELNLKPNRCPCILHGLWLNIIVAFDSSDGAGITGFAAQKAAVTALLHRIFIKQKEGQFSKIAFLNTGNTTEVVSHLTKYNFATEAIEELRKMKLVGGLINLESAFQAANNLFSEHNQHVVNKNIKNVLVVFTTVELRCDQQMFHGCQMAEKLRGDGVKIITVDLFVTGGPRYEGSTFGDRCLWLTNDIGFMQTFEEMLCRANCFCLPPTIHFRNENTCDIFGQCVYLEETAVGTEAAKISCGLNLMSLVDVYTENKDEFLTEVAKLYGAKRYIIGLQNVYGHLIWSSGKTLDSNEFNLYGAGEPDVRHGNCTYAEIDSSGKSSWKTMACSYTSPAEKYFCQRDTCDTEHYCSAQSF